MNFQRGNLLWLNFSPNKGHEQAGRRPAVVISPAAYNGVSHCMLVCPITSNTDPWPWKVVLPENLSVGGAILVDQIKSIDAKARKAEPTGDALPEDVLSEVMGRLGTLVTA